MPAEPETLPMARRIGLACLAVVVAAVVVAAGQVPPAPRLTGEAPPPASPLSLWYRAPAADHPLLPAGASREARQAATAEWVRALPVGTGRLGAMVFGGIVHERLQLNEDTLWAGRPYDPVNPEAKAALPEVRRLLAERKYQDAAKLLSAKVMSKPLAQMPYQTLGDLALTFPATEAVENYRRELDLETATTRVSYVSDGVTFSREIFASAPDQVIVVRLTASRPGRISLRGPAGDAAARDGRGHGRRRRRHARGQWRRRWHHRGWTTDDRCPALRSAGPRPCDRRDAPRQRRCGRRS